MKLPQKFTGFENHLVTRAEVQDFVENFSQAFSSAAPAGGFVDKAAVLALVEQENAVGIRYYYGVGQDGETRLLWVGTDRDRNDLLEGETVKHALLNPPLSIDGTYTPFVVDHEIEMTDAARLTATYRLQKENHQPYGGFFGKQVILRIMHQDDCVGLRYYYGADSNGIRVVCLMGVDSKGNDIPDGQLAELSTWCPPMCGVANPLNSGITIEEFKRNTESIIENGNDLDIAA